MKALLFAEGGNLDNLYNSRNKIHHIIAENYCRSEKLMYDMTDKNFTPPSPIRPVRRSPNLDFACKTTASVGPSPDSSHDDSDLQALVTKRDELLSDLRSAVEISNQFSKSSLKALSAKPTSTAKNSLGQENHSQAKSRSSKETRSTRKNAHKGNMKLRKKR
mmetsp:Transcript_38247/g.37760  ORF Transcript_38247/g.37760 Transcript_38247/m.37760 type:complete len:162 (-) Transcript_38247:88-573(-)